jgi:hypothetical protein
MEFGETMKNTILTFTFCLFTFAFLLFTFALSYFPSLNFKWELSQQCRRKKYYRRMILTLALPFTARKGAFTDSQEISLFPNLAISLSIAPIRVRNDSNQRLELHRQPSQISGWNGTIPEWC